MVEHRRHRWLSVAFIVLCSAALGGCAAVSVRANSSPRVASDEGGDALTTAQLGRDTRSTLLTLGMDAKRCQSDAPMCLQRLRESGHLTREQRFAAMAEIALTQAIGREEAGRQTVPTDLAIAPTFKRRAMPMHTCFAGNRRRHSVHSSTGRHRCRLFTITPWNDRPADLRAGKEQCLPPAEARRGAPSRRLDTDPRPHGTALARGRDQTRRDRSGVAIEYRGHAQGRDGLGAALVAVARPATTFDENAVQSGIGIGYLPVTLLITFPDSSVDALLQSRHAQVELLDPYRHKTVMIDGVDVPLTANFTAPYALWLAQSGFGKQALAGVFGRRSGVKHARVFMMQPYDPSRMTIVMLHGLASSPEAWVNMANEVIGDDVLRDRYQVWQVYYPTNLPIPGNRKEIGEALGPRLIRSRGHRHRTKAS